MASVNSCTFVGNLGKDPECRDVSNGQKVANFSIACTEKWKSKDGEKQERTTWVPVVVWGPLADVCQRYLHKGSKVYVSGKFSVRKFQDRDGNDRYATEIVLQGPQAQLVMLDGKPADGGRAASNEGTTTTHYGAHGGQSSGGFADDLSDEIPF